MEFSLSKYNKINRNGKNRIDTDYIIRKRGTLLHVCLNSIGCRYRNSGSCTMCDYGEGYRLNKEQMMKIALHIKRESIGMQSILIGTLGSVLDSEEISLECLQIICDILNEVSVRTVIFETHYTMINDEICLWLKDKLPNKDIVIEVGLESVDQFVQKKCLNKIIDLKELSRRTELLHSYGMSITANVFLGAPFLSVKEQIEDTINTIQWAIENKVDSVVIFPANIRKNTLLYELYSLGEYTLVSHWAIYDLLCRIPCSFLDRIYLAWYGDWVDMDEEGCHKNLTPYACEKCERLWLDFYCNFLSESSCEKRKEILQRFNDILSNTCKCKVEFLHSLEKQEEKNRELRMEEIYNRLVKCLHKK